MNAIAINTSEYKINPLHVATAGLIGGLGAWVWAMTVGPEPLIKDLLFAVPAYMFLGAIAGCLGVYLVAKTDPSLPGHALSFSLACGIFWGPVISGAQAIVSRSQVEQRAQGLNDKQTQLFGAQEQLTKRAEELQAEINATATRAEELEQAKARLLELSRSTVGPSAQILSGQIAMINFDQVRDDLKASHKEAEKLNMTLARISLKEDLHIQ